MFQNIPVVIVAAMSKDRHVIGRENELLWHIPDDLKRFKELTLGHPVVLGRKTFESIIKILGKPLPNRPNIVVTRNSNFNFERVEIAPSLEKAFEKAHAHNPTEIHIGGGSEIYKQALPYVDKLKLTFVDDEPEGDVFFPAFENDFVVERKHAYRSYGNLLYEWVDFVRKESV